MWSEKGFLFLFAQLLLCSVGFAFFDFQPFDWITRRNGDKKPKDNVWPKIDKGKGRELEEIHFKPDTNAFKGQELEDFHFEPKEGSKGQEAEEIYFGSKPDHLKGQEVEDFHFGPKEDNKGQEVEEIHFGPKPDNPKDQEVEEIHFGPKPEHPQGQEVEEINFGLKPKDPKGQEKEEIHFGPSPEDPKRQEVEGINFGPKPENPTGQEVEEIHFEPKPDYPKGQEVEDFHFGPKPENSKGQEVEEIHFGPKSEDPKGQEVEEIYFEPKPNGPKDQEVENIYSGPKPSNPKGQEVEEINFGPKPKDPKGQEAENFHFWSNPDDPKGQEVEEIHFEPKPDYPKGQEVEDFHFGPKPENSKGQEVEEIHFGPKPEDPKGQEVEEIYFEPKPNGPKDQEVENIYSGPKPSNPKGQEVEDFHFGPKPENSKGQEVEEIHFGPKPEDPKGEVEEIHFGPKPEDPKGQEVENITFGPKPDEPKGQEEEGTNFEYFPLKPEDNPKGKEGEEIIFGSEFDCKEKPLTISNSYIKCESLRKCELFCQEGFRFSSGSEKLVYECDRGAWIPTDNITSHCYPVCEPPCQNNGVCIGNNQCSCPKNFEGTHCQFSARPCTDNPPVPISSFLNCNASKCVVKCFDNHIFPDGSSTVDLTCHHGQWTWANTEWLSLPDCKPSCEPPCINGGSCLDYNKCQCPRQYAGPQCQFDVSVCDAKKLNFNGIYTCRGEADKVSCTISCPEGHDSDIPIADHYTCHYSDAKFLPEPIPKCIYENADVVKFQSSSHTIQGGFQGFESGQVPSNSPPTADCTSWRSHFKNFDGEVFSFDGGCSYVLVQDVENTFRITAEKSSCESTQCPRYLRIHYQYNEYEIHFEGKTPSLKANGEVIQVPSQLGDFLCEKLGDKLIITLQTIDVSLKWDAQDRLTINVNDKMWNKTSGICGNFNGNPVDDMHTPDGVAAVNLEAFIRSWMEESHICGSTLNTKNECREDNAVNYCQNIFSDVHFEKCLTAEKLALYKEACVWDTCKCGEHCACDTVSEFVKSCKKHLIDQGLPDTTSDWRQIAECHLNCSVGKVYSACGPSLEPTCGYFGMDKNLAKYSECVEGCFCPEGLVNYNGSCIKKEYCPCYWRNSYYNAGDVIRKDCNTCTCQNGEWTCTTLQCSSTCGVVGNSHIFTFDGRRYDLMGQCSYYLLKSDEYSIASENLACEGEFTKEIFQNFLSKFSSCSKLITIRHGTNEIKLKKDKEVLLNNLEISSLPVEADGVLIRRTSHYVIVTLTNLTEVWWDGNANVYIDIPGNQNLKKATGGLCGTFNNNQKDDFKTPEGDIEQTAKTFVEKWKTDESCIEISNSQKLHPCDENDSYKKIAEEQCQKLKGNIFKDCHASVDVEPFYKNCLHDVCSCQKDMSLCICPIFADYARECARQYMEVPWRNEIHECGLHCKNGEIYQPCADSCTRSCQDISAMKGHCDKKCAEGCSCPDGLVLNTENKCVPVSECPCFYLNFKYRADHQIIMESQNGSQSCTCQNALWSCRPATKLEIAREYENSDYKCDETVHEEYTNCKPAEPKTCKNMHEKPKHSTRICFPGCVCKKGFVWDSIGKLCVNASECPCHHGGKSYTNGEKIQQDCNSCTCENGVWSCTHRDCSAVCSTWGDSHFKTFDGKIYDFQGSCEYVLAAGSISEHESFFISLQIVPCGTSGISCPKSLTLKIESLEKEEKVVFKKSKPLLIPTNLKRILVREVGLFVFAEILDLGISVQWDKGTRVYVKADARWKNKVKGLCGSFNDNELDDFKTPSSGETNEISQVLFADSWRLDLLCPQSHPITDTCAHRPHRKTWAVEKCSVLNSEIFERCHSEVLLEPYLERCIVDTCGCDEGGDCDCLCAAVSAYAEECTLKGIPIKWRSQNLCPLQCDGKSKYNPCVSKCPPKSCDNQYHHSVMLQTCSEDSCVEGCEKPRCPPGHVFADSSSHRCIPIASCKTVCLTINNVTYLEGDLMESDDCHSCYCSHHDKVCTGEPCPEVITTVLPTPTSACPEGEIWDDCIVKCDRVCNYLTSGVSSSLHCSNGCVSGCRAINLKCPSDMFLRDTHSCVKKKDCPCRSTLNSLVKPGDVVEETECEKCQCVNNEYECFNLCTLPSVQTTSASRNYTKKHHSATTGWDYSIEGNVTLMHHKPTASTISCPSGRYESLLGPLTKFSASSSLNDFSLPEFCRMTSKGSWVAGDNNADQYLQVDLLRVEPIYAVNVAGNLGNYVTSYYLLYSLNGVKFEDMFSQDGRKEIFGGPFDGHHSIKQVLPMPVEARYIRFHPVSWHGQISMKVDVLGCKEPIEFTTPHSTTPVPSICNKPIGIGQKYFPKLQITVTSSKPNNGPDLIGFDNERGWQPLTNSKSEWVQLDFGENVNFTGITTKGVSQGNELFSLFLGDSWVERYKIEYSHDGISWNPILDEFGDPMTFMGNTDGETEKKNFFKRPIRARALKILPLKWHENIALRLDVMGCYEPSHFPLQVTPPVIVPAPECNLCPGAVFNREHCNCTEEKWWDGENCVGRSECPCYKGLIAYPVGSTFSTENCDECVCRLYGLSHCTPKHCPDCPKGLQKILTPLCGCSCKLCEEKTRLCPTSNICLEETAWCDGIQDCPDDELNCTTTAPKTVPTPSPCKPICPPGYDVVYRNKTSGPTEAEDMILSRKAVKTKKSVKTYRKPKKNRKLQKITECPPYDCVPDKEAKEIECPSPQCPVEYLVVKQKFNELTEACPLYTCEPVPEYANCSVLSKNIKTFDGLEYKFEICDHVLATHDSGKWNITVFKNCSFGVSCVNILLVNHGQHSLELNPHQGLIKFDSFPYTIEQVELLSSRTTEFTINIIGDSIIFVSDIYGFEVVYDAKGNINVNVPSSMKGHLIGLCGLYNGHPADDKTLPDGILSKTSVEFGEAWFNPGGKQCVETVCPIEMQNTALEVCLKLKEKPFNACHPSANLELCVESTCDCLVSNVTEDECRCRTLSDFAAKCKNSNLFGWRMEHDCPSSCPPNLVHYDCYPYTCQPTCGSEECTEPSTSCYSGCFCQDGLVKRGNECIKALECRDCVCSGLGDSTYLTFDGAMTFDGTCTYVAAREKTSSGNPGFQVLFSNSLCNGSDFKTCTDKVEVNVRDHSIKVVALPGAEEMVTVLIDEQKLDFKEAKKVDKSWAKITFNPEVSAVLVELPQQHVDVRYFYKRFAFTISLPSHFYSGKLEGFCGTCSQNVQEAEEVNDPEKWQTENDKSCVMEPPPPCIPTAEHKKMCLLMNDTKTFGQCLAFVDPIPFIDQCLSSVCINGHMCSSFEAYAQACRDAGICVNWRSDDFCPFTCSSDLEYQACNIGCHKTCENYDELLSACVSPPVEGCFCPNDQILINGTCKPEKYCEFCDEDGHHFEDESWQADKCTNCTCHNRVITCERFECPRADIICGEDEILLKEENDFDCCPKHKCVCKHRDECAKVVMPTDLLPGMEAFVNDSGCCPRVEVVCRRENCPAINPCKEHYVQKIYNTTACCPDHHCEKPENICIYDLSGKSTENIKRVKRGENVEIVKEIGESWTDGPCKTCVCVETDGFAEIVCSVTECPGLKEHHDYKEYYLEEIHDPEKCCPEVVRKSCKHDGHIYNVGDTWVPDENNPCETMKCNDWGGVIVKETRLEVCNKNCEQGWEYKHSEGRCCGHCVQVGCLADDKIYKPGEVWYSEDKCAKSTCKDHNGHYSISTEMESCPSIEDCPQEDIYRDKCCLKCKLSMEDLKICDTKPLPPESTIHLVHQRKGRHGLCHNVNPVQNFTQCAGNCESYTVFKPESSSHESVCKCCKPQEYSIITVPLTCEDGIEFSKTITVPSKCSCTPCGG